MTISQERDMCKHSILFYTTTSNFYTFLFTRPHRPFVFICSLTIHFILHRFFNMQSACTLLKLGEVHTSNVYVVVVGAMPSCCIHLCVLKYRSIPFCCGSIYWCCFVSSFSLFSGSIKNSISKSICIF